MTHKFSTCLPKVTLPSVRKLPIVGTISFGKSCVTEIYLNSNSESPLKLSKTKKLLLKILKV